MIFTINGVDIVPYLAENGLKWSWNGIDSPESGRDLSATMHRGLVSIKARCDVSCFWMNKTAARTVHQAIMPEYVTVVTDTIPWENGTVTMTMYSNNVEQSLETEYTDGVQMYKDLQFPLIER